MTDRHDGGAAFPHKRIYRCSQGIDHELQETGMSLRDWFAGQALHKGVVNGDWDSSIQWRAKSAYEMADAMLAARSEDKP